MRTACRIKTKCFTNQTLQNGHKSRHSRAHPDVTVAFDVKFTQSAGCDNNIPQVAYTYSSVSAYSTKEPESHTGALLLRSGDCIILPTPRSALSTRYTYAIQPALVEGEPQEIKFLLININDRLQESREARQHNSRTHHQQTWRIQTA